MQTDSQVSWDPPYISYRLDLTTKLTILYLMISGLVFLFCTIKFLLTNHRLKTFRAALRKETPAAEQNYTTQLKIAYSGLQRAQTSLTKWSRSTILVLLIYSANQSADIFSFISHNRSIGISVMAGSLANLFNMWRAGLWLLLAFSTANWILTNRLKRWA